MTSTLVSVVSHGEQRQARPRSLSATDPPSPESISSDSHSSSDLDTHLSSISSWLPTPTAPGLKGFGMDVDDFSGHSIMEHSELTFRSRMNEMHAVDAYSDYNVKEIMHDNTSSSTKQDILMLEELIRDGVYDAASTPTPYSSYSPSMPLQTSAPSSILADSCLCPVIPSQSSMENPSPPLTSTTLPISNEPTRTPNQSDCFAYDSSEVIELTPNAWDADQTTVKTEAQCSAQSSFDQVPSAIISSLVAYPPKEVCIGLPIVFSSIPLAGTKSRVETQIKLVLDLATPVSSSSQFHSTLPSRSSSVSDGSSLTASPPVIYPNLPDSETTKLSPTHDRVGTYSYLRLPYGTTTKRRSTAAGGRCDSNSGDSENTLQVTADVVCCSAPTIAIQSCQSCQAREAKRTARKLAARVRPPSNAKRAKAKESKKTSKKVNDEEFDGLPQMEDVEEEPNVDASILQFNCGEILRFSSGSVTLPMRITCYCRHHKEKIGFQIIFTLTDYQGRIVGRGTTPPILITDDHKSNNAVSKLPPMHPLRQTLHPTPPARTVPLPVAIAEPQHPVSLPTSEENVRPYTRRREVTETSQRRKRAKPYDGRPNRTSGINPGIEGRQGVVLALHPAHTRMQEPRSQPGSAHATRSSTPISETRFILPSQSINGLRNADCQSPNANLLSEMYPPSPTQSLVSPSSGTAAQGQSTLLSQMDVQYPQSSSSAQLPTSTAAPIYSVMSFPTEMPKIHRLIPSSGPTTGGIEITVLGSHFHPSMSLECVFGGAVASSTHRWSDNTLVCVLPPRATPGLVAVAFKGIKHEDVHDEPACLFNYVDECDRQLMELALQVVGLKMTGKIEEARNVAMRIVGNTQSPNMTVGEVTQMNTLPDAPLLHHQLLGSLSGIDLETLTIKLLTLVDVPVANSGSTSSDMHPINHKNATGQTLLHLAVLLALPSLVSCLIGRSIDLDAQNSNGLTALHFAAMAGWKEGVELLINGGAQTNIVDEMGLAPTDRAIDAGFASLTEILDEHCSTRSGDEGDDERWQSDRGDSEDVDSDTSPSGYSPAYHTHSRVTSSTHVHKESSETESPTESAPVSTVKADILMPSQDTKKYSLPNEKHDTSFVERLQRTLPQGILHNMQIPGFLQIQLPERAWGALPNIPVFPILVPLPNWPWNDSNGSKKENGASEEKQQQQQPSFATLWTAYDSIANNAWRTQWEKWTAHVTALQTANNNRDSAELPPYTPREDSQSEQLETAPLDETAVPPVPIESRPSQSFAHSPLAKVKRRVGYGTVAIPETEVEAYHYKPTKRQRLKSKQDHMLVLFWIPILCIGLAYALYTTLPLAFQFTKRLLPTLSRRI